LPSPRHAAPPAGLGRNTLGRNTLGRTGRARRMRHAKLFMARLAGFRGPRWTK
jgi:hypothetical protein